MPMPGMPYPENKPTRWRRIQEMKKVIKSIYILLACFILLKLTGMIDWSWFLVLMPAWIMMAFGAGAWTVMFYVMFKEMYINQSGRANKH
jgi:hypothetical protein